MTDSLPDTAATGLQDPMDVAAAVERGDLCFRCEGAAPVPGLAVCGDCVSSGPLRPVRDEPLS